MSKHSNILQIEKCFSVFTLTLLMSHICVYLSGTDTHICKSLRYFLLNLHFLGSLRSNRAA